MCGIVGYIGEKKAAPILVNGLKKLEYRGYDSAGIALFEDGRLSVVKCKGRLAALEEKLGGTTIGTVGGNIGIGHTRWATHGEPNDVNSHPHLSNSGKIAVVHNGIIENYMKLKKVSDITRLRIHIRYGYRDCRTACGLLLQTKR